jgi:hypothetical protein
MSDIDWREQLPPRVLTMQIIVGAMSFGCFCFLIIAILIAPNMENADKGSLLTYIALGYAAAILAIGIFLPGIIFAQGRKNIHQKLFSTGSQIQDNAAVGTKEKENGKVQLLLQIFQTKTIVVCAIFEGSAFFLIITYMVDHSIYLVAAAVVLLILLTAKMPTTGRVTNWIEDNLRLLDEEREFG